MREKICIYFSIDYLPNVTEREDNILEVLKCEDMLSNEGMIFL